MTKILLTALVLSVAAAGSSAADFIAGKDVPDTQLYEIRFPESDGLLPCEMSVTREATATAGSRLYSFRERFHLRV